MTLSATKSAQVAGLLDTILPVFKAASNLRVRVTAADTAEAVAVAQRGEADAVLLDDRPAQDKFVADGYGLGRRDMMYDDRVIVGPSADPAGIRGLKDAGKAFAQIAAKGTPFVSRGDDSLTHRIELRLWQTPA